jgi:hypothetical protein
MYDILKNEKDNEQEIFKIIEDTEKYQNEIKNAKEDEVISATEILRDIHISLSEFINLSFGVMNSKLN